MMHKAWCSIEEVPYRLSCDQAALKALICRLSVRPSVRPSVTPFWQLFCHRIILKFSGVITIDRHDARGSLTLWLILVSQHYCWQIIYIYIRNKKVIKCVLSWTGNPVSVTEGTSLHVTVCGNNWCDLWRQALRAKFMGPTWGPSVTERTQLGPMLAPSTLLSWECNSLTSTTVRYSL